MNFTKKDIQQIEAKGLTVNQVQAQIDLFKAGLPFLNLKAAATIGPGPRFSNRDLSFKGFFCQNSYLGQIFCSF